MAFYPIPDESETLGLIFLSLLSAGAILTTLLLLVIVFSPHLHRHATWLNFAFSWVVFSLSYIILYIGGKTKGSEPAFSLCLGQASMIYAAPVLCGSTAFALILQIWFDQRSKMCPDPPRPHLVRTSCLIIGPWLVSIGVFVEALVLGLKTPDEVARMGNFAYCVIKTTIPGHISAFTIVGILILSVVFQVMIARGFYKHYRKMENDYRARFSASVMLRLSVFTLVVLGTVGVLMMFSSDGLNRKIVDGLIAPLPLVLFCIFGLQRDVLQVVLCRGRPVAPRIGNTPEPANMSDMSDMSSVIDIT